MISAIRGKARNYRCVYGACSGWLASSLTGKPGMEANIFLLL